MKHFTGALYSKWEQQEYMKNEQTRMEKVFPVTEELNFYKLFTRIYSFNDLIIVAAVVVISYYYSFNLYSE
jgi:hypothetical protein